MVGNSYKLDISLVDETNILTTKEIVSGVSFNNYKLIHYEKEYLGKDLVSTMGIFRSVILNNDGKVVCFAPPKSLDTDVFMLKYPDPAPSTENYIIAEEFVDGVMINVFYSNGNWEIATKNTVGSSKFVALFYETMQTVGLTFERLDKTLCYSFVMRNPKFKIVSTIINPELYLINVYRIIQLDPKNTMIYNVSDLQIPEVQLDCVKYPKIYKDWTSYGDLIDGFGSMNTSCEIVGVMVYHRITGERVKIRNPAFEKLRHMKGEDKKLRYLYCRLRKQGVDKVVEYVKENPQYKKKFYEFRNEIYLYTHTLFQNYIDCYVHKKKPLGEYPREYKTHMFELHKKYVNDLKPENKYVTKAYVVDYCNNEVF